MFSISSCDYMRYLQSVAQRIAADKDYITKLDADTGDGDHWANINMGFEALVEAAAELSQLPICDCFRRIGMLMMSTIGGSSGVLYGGAYLAAAKAISGKDVIGPEELARVLCVMASDMMARGKSECGYKTMIDSLYPAAEAYSAALEAGLPDAEALTAMKKAAVAGAERTRDMEAVRGRASYQTNKGVGHLDPGAVTMSYQLETLADYVIGHVL